MKFFRVFLLFFSLFCCLLREVTLAQTATDSLLQEGDLIFQNSECGALCHNINEVTPAIMGRHYAHIGIVVRENGRCFVLEATGDQVQENTLTAFLARSDQPVLIGRLRAPYRHLIDSAVKFAHAQIGVPYDHAFIYNNGRYYCAELVYDAFKAANGGKSFFSLQPMTFKRPGTHKFFPGWVRYYRQLQMDIPEGQPGCNPGSIGQSPYLKLFFLPSPAQRQKKQPAVEKE